MSTEKVIATDTAWNLIGFPDSDEYMNRSFSIRVKGGRAHYEAVMFRCDTRGDKVLLARLEADQGLHQVNRWVDADTILEVVEK